MSIFEDDVISSSKIVLVKLKKMKLIRIVK